MSLAMEKSHRAAFNLQLIEALQSQYPAVFIRAAVYDGKKNLYTSFKLDFGSEVSRQVRFLKHRIVRFMTMNTVQCDLDRRDPSVEFQD